MHWNISIIMFDWLSIYHLIDYREMILALTLWLREWFLSIGWGFDIIYRWLASVLDYPIQIAIWSMSMYGLFARLVSIKLFFNAWLIDIRQSLYFIPVSMIGGALWSYATLVLASQYFTLVIGIILTIMGINYFKPLFRGSGWMDRFSHHTYDKYIWYIVLIMSEAVTVVVWGWWMLSNHKTFLWYLTIEGIMNS